MRVTYTANVTVSGTPRVPLNTTPAQYATYASGSGTTVLSFTYTVQAGDASSQLDAAGSLDLNGGGITSTGGSNTSLTLPTGSATTGALAKNKFIVIDAVPPSSFTIITPSWPLKTATPTLSWNDPGDADAFDIKIVATRNCADTAVAGQSYADLASANQALSALASGYYYACVTAKDLAGNTTAAANQPLPFLVTLPNSWIKIPNTLTNTPIARGNGDHSYLGATGPYAQKHILWGGYVSGSSNTATGAIFDAVNYTWTPMTTTGAPSGGRFDDGHAWTGDTGDPSSSHKFIVWGGGNGGGYSQATGAMYNPATDSWAPISTTGAPSARHAFPYAWTGNTGVPATSHKLLIWGGLKCTISNCTTYPTDGFLYDPKTDSWSAISSTGAPPGRYLRITMWDDDNKRLFVWGGQTSAPLAGGAYYELATDTWKPISTTGAPAKRDHFAGVATGNTGDPATQNRVIIWGGRNDTGAGAKWLDLNDGAVYNVATNSWTAMSSVGAPTARGTLSYWWTGSKLLVWFGNYMSNGTMAGGRNDAFLYDLKTNSWSQASTTAAPTVGRFSDMRRDWGGSDKMVFSFFGYEYSGSPVPVNDSWIYVLP